VLQLRVKLPLDWAGAWVKLDISGRESPRGLWRLLERDFGCAELVKHCAEDTHEHQLNEKEKVKAVVVVVHRVAIDHLLIIFFLF
jgi:hypothetical protein